VSWLSCHAGMDTGERACHFLSLGRLGILGGVGV
jgi:hypothetical protein